MKKLIKKTVNFLMLGAAFFGCQNITMMRKFNSGSPIFGSDRSIIPFELEHHKIIVPVFINSETEPVNFILDTGALTMVSKATASKLGLKQGAAMPTMKDSVSAYLTNTSLIKLGDMAVEDFTIPMMDLGSFFGGGFEIGGFIGTDFLRFFNVQIDYNKKELILSKNPLPPHEAKKSIELPLSSPFPLRFPEIELIFDDTLHIQSMIDTGSPFPLIMPEKYLPDFQNQDRKIIKSKGVLYSWPGPDPECNYITRTDIDFGNIRIKGLPIIFTSLPGPVKMPLIGKEILDRFVPILNFSEEKAVFPYDDTPEFRDNYFTFGLMITKKDSAATIRGLWEGSPADRAGLIPGDILRTLNGRDCSTMKGSEINALLEDEELIKVELEIERDGNISMVILDKANLF